MHIIKITSTTILHAEYNLYNILCSPLHVWGLFLLSLERITYTHATDIYLTQSILSVSSHVCTCKTNRWTGFIWQFYNVKLKLNAQNKIENNNFSFAMSWCSNSKINEIPALINKGEKKRKSHAKQIFQCIFIAGAVFIKIHDNKWLLNVNKYVNKLEFTLDFTTHKIKAHQVINWLNQYYQIINWI